MPFSAAFDDHPVIERALRVRRNPIAAYGMAVFVVALATLAHWLLDGQVVEGVPFLTYYPAIIIATLVGGLWPGVLATVLSSVAAVHLFLLPLFGPDPDQPQAVSLLLFIVVSGINVTVVALLDSAVERIMTQVQSERVLFNSAPTGIVVVDKQGLIRLVNRSAEHQFGYNRAELVGKRIEVLLPLAQVAQHRKLRESFLQKPEARAMGAGRDLSGRRKDGSEFPVEIGLNPVGRDGRTAILATIIDISDRKTAQESEKFIVRELQHRTQNLFAVFQAIASRTVDESRTAAEIKHLLNGRLQALGQAYAIVADAAWEGVPLTAILDRELAGFSNNVNVAGCDVIVGPSAAQQFALIIHELVTNAIKYGALSVPDGVVSVEGKIDRLNGGGTFSFAWRETGGPAVTAPTRKGFGSVILLDSARQFSQDVALDYARQGLRYELQLQLTAIEPSSAVAKPQSNATLGEVRAG